MKKLLFLPFLLFLLQESTQDQQQLKFRIIYELNYQVDSTDVNSRRSEEMHLYVGNGISRFSSYGKLVKDSLKLKTSKSIRQLDMARLLAQMPKTDFNYTIFKGIPAGKLSFTERLGRDDFVYTEDLHPMKWQITQEVDSLAGYPVRKATTRYRGRDYIAWYTPEIPVTDGPYKFSGLPGLILKIADVEKHYSFEFTGIKELAEPLSLSFEAKQHLETNRKKFLELKDEFERNPIDALQGAGIKIHFSPDQQRKADREIKEKLKRENNPLELND